MMSSASKCGLICRKLFDQRHRLGRGTRAQSRRGRKAGLCSCLAPNAQRDGPFGRRKSNGFLSLLGNFLGQQRPQCFVPILVTSGSRSLSGIKCR
jgi:hypothetical protein